MEVIIYYITRKIGILDMKKDFALTKKIFNKNKAKIKKNKFLFYYTRVIVLQAIFKSGCEISAFDELISEIIETDDCN